MNLGEHVRVRGTVQGVGFRPAVARLARDLGLYGFVLNDGDGVLVALRGPGDARDRFVARLRAELPPLARIDALERTEAQVEGDGFVISPSQVAAPRTAVAPDAATCAACREDVRDPLGRRFRYPFTTCTHCGPRFSIVTGIPYDRAQTTMAAFPMCEVCRAEYDDERDRRYHAQPIACFTCGPRARLVRLDGRASTFEALSMLDDVDAGATILHRGEILLVLGLGGFQILADATRAEVVDRLRNLKLRPHKPLALMGRDLDVLRAHVHIDAAAERALTSPAGPIVLLPRRAESQLPHGLAPGQPTLGVMLPTTPLHQLLLARVKHPVVCTSGNLSDAPMVMTLDEATDRLRGVANWALTHDRPVATRVDDSVVQMVEGEPQVVRRARGLAPAPIALPPGLEAAPPLLALGGQYKNTVALTCDGQVVLSQHLGDLDEPANFEAWQHTVDLLTSLYDLRPRAVAVDLHPEYRPTRMGRGLAAARSIPCIEVQHHHAHVAACLAEHGWPADGGRVLGLAWDGLGYGSDGTLWGGELLLADYHSFERVATVRPVALLGGDAASRAPWRSLYAHLRAQMSWGELDTNHGDVAVIQDLRRRPVDLLEQMLQKGTQAPLASSVGRLFDAVAAALGVFPEQIDDEGQAAMALTGLVDDAALDEALAGERYPVPVPRLASGLPYLEWVWMWRALLGDLHAGVPAPLIAARFHVALADAAARLVEHARSRLTVPDTVVLSGGVWQNVILTTRTAANLRAHGMDVKIHRRIPPNDGCIALGQAVVAAARLTSR